MPTTPELEQRRLDAEFSEGYCIHTISCESGIRKEKWTRGISIGEGTFGTVWVEKEQSTAALRAIKQIKKTNNEKDLRELLILRKLEEYPQHFVQLLGWFQDEKYIYVATEYIWFGDLHKFIHEDDLQIDEGDTKVIVTQILQGLNIMHENNICHRDLKPKNILMASLSPIIVKICDFGVSKEVANGVVLRTSAGTFGYMAPEISDDFLYSNTSVYTKAVDIWSLGCLIYEIITKEMPFDPDTDGIREYMRKRIRFPKAKLVEKKATPAAIKFITSLLRPSPEKRLTAGQALKDPWLKVEEGARVQRQERREEDTWERSLDQALVTDSKPKQDRTSNLRELNSSSSEWSSPDERVVLHDCTTLSCAVTHGNLDAARRLCRDSLVDVNAKQPGRTDGWTALHLAVEKGDEALVKLLLENRADTTVKSNDAWKWTALHIAAQAGHEEVTKLLLENGADVMARGKDEWTALHRAAHYGKEEIAKLLLKGRADVLTKGSGGWTVLRVAAENGHEPLVKLFLENGANAKAGDESGITPLHVAAQNGHEGTVRLLLKDKTNMAIKDKTGRTALHLAADNGREGTTKLLLDNGADVMVRDNDGWTPLHLTARGGHEKVAELLLESGAEITTKGKDGWTALHRAAHFGQEGMAKFLLENGAEITAKGSTGWTVLIVAAGMGHENLVRLFLEKGADVMGKDGNGFTALHRAAWKGQEGTARLLLENGANMTTKDKRGWTPLRAAAEDGCEGTVKLLLEHGASTMARDNIGWTALHVAAWGGYEGVAKLLLENGADVMAKGKDQWTALHRATHFGQEEVVKLLLGNGADIMAGDNTGWTALRIAVERGNDDMIKLLLENGADILAKDDFGKSPLDVASEKGHENVVKLLLENSVDTTGRRDKGEKAVPHQKIPGSYTETTELLLRDENVKGDALLDVAVRETTHEEVTRVSRKKSIFSRFQAWIFGA